MQGFQAGNFPLKLTFLSLQLLLKLPNLSGHVLNFRFQRVVRFTEDAALLLFPVQLGLRFLKGLVELGKTQLNREHEVVLLLHNCLGHLKFLHLNSVVRNLP